MLGDGADGVAHLGSGGKGWRVVVGEAGVAVGVSVGDLAVLDQGDGGGGNAGLLEDLACDAVDAFAEGRVDGVDGLGGDGRHDEDEGGKDSAERDSGHGIWLLDLVSPVPECEGPGAPTSF